MVYRIGFVSVYLALLIAYFFSETSGNFRRRCVNKIAMASLFLIFALAAYLRAGRFPGIDLVLLAGLLFSFLGDVLLLWSFYKGGVFFNIGNYLLFAYELLLIRRLEIPVARLWPAAAVFLLFWGGTMSAKRMGLLDFGKVRIFPEYLLSVSLHGSLGLALALAYPTPRMLLLGCGLFLFMVSDYFLTVREFVVRKNWVLRCNSGTYFVGMMLAALSVSCAAW